MLEILSRLTSLAEAGAEAGAVDAKGPLVLWQEITAKSVASGAAGADEQIPCVAWLTKQFTTETALDPPR
jgi:hypothetical protein